MEKISNDLLVQLYSDANTLPVDVDLQVQFLILLSHELAHRNIS